jgi:hypothetical protein
MKKKILQLSGRIGLMLVVALTIVNSSAKAQSLEYGLKVRIPFDFKLDKQEFPAGDYSFRRATSSSGDLVVHIESADGKANGFPMTFPVIGTKTHEKGGVVFHRYGNDYFLAEVWAPGSTTGRGLPKSDGERELQKRLGELSDAAPKEKRVGTITIEVTGP